MQCKFILSIVITKGTPEHVGENQHEGYEVNGNFIYCFLPNLH